MIRVDIYIYIETMNPSWRSNFKKNLQHFLGRRQLPICPKPLSRSLDQALILEVWILLEAFISRLEVLPVSLILGAAQGILGVLQVSLILEATQGILEVRPVSLILEATQGILEMYQARRFLEVSQGILELQNLERESPLNQEHLGQALLGKKVFLSFCKDVSLI